MTTTKKKKPRPSPTSDYQSNAKADADPNPNKKERALCSSVDVACPFCGVVEPMSLDEGGGEYQTLVEDCPVCCKPRVVHVDASRRAKAPRVRVERDDGM
jgi:hypothetical protein